MKDKLIVILPRVPYPLEKGDKLRAFHQLRFLAQEFRVYLFALHHGKLNEKEALQKLEPYCEELHIIRRNKAEIAFHMFEAWIKGLPVQCGYFVTARAKRILKAKAAAIKAPYVYCQLIRTAELAKQISGIKTIDYQDVFSKGVERRLQNAPWWLKPVFASEARRLKRYEHHIFEIFDQKTIISKPDRDLIPHPEKEKIHIIPNGVDHDFFTANNKVQKDTDLVFTGNMSYPPNVRSAEFLAHEILPLAHKKKPGLKLMLAGASPHSRVQALQSEFIEVTGWMDDIRDAYNRSKIFIAPMQIGTGLQNKLLEAMSMGLPSITSDLANDALMAEKGKDILIGTDAQSYADHIIKLIEDVGFANKIAQSGNRFVKGRYDWKEASIKLANIIRQKI